MFLSINSTEIPVNPDDCHKIPARIKSNDHEGLSGDFIASEKNIKCKWRIGTAYLTPAEYLSIKNILNGSPPFLIVTGDMVQNKSLTCDAIITGVKDYFLGLAYVINFELIEIADEETYVS